MPCSCIVQREDGTRKLGTKVSPDDGLTFNPFHIGTVTQKAEYPSSQILIYQDPEVMHAARDATINTSEREVISAEGKPAEGPISIPSTKVTATLKDPMSNVKAKLGDVVCYCLAPPDGGGFAVLLCEGSLR